MIEKIGCVEILVSNIEKSVGLYENVLGLEKILEHPA